MICLPRQPQFSAPQLAKLINEPAKPIATCLSLEGKRGMTRALLEVCCLLSNEFDGIANSSDQDECKTAPGEYDLHMMMI